MATTWTFRLRLMVAAVIVAVTSLVLGAGGSAAAQAAFAEGQPASQPAVSVGASTSVVSAFVWRGWVVADDVCMQPSVWIEARGVTISSWGNVWPHNEGDSLTEHDLTVDYTRAVGRWQLSAGYINYFFKSLETGRWSNELYVGAAMPGPLNPSVRIYQDIHQGSGTYMSAGVSHGVAVGSKGLSITPSAVLGYNNHQWVEGSGWSDVSMGAVVAFPLSGHLDASVSMNYSRSLNTDWFPSKAWGGVTVSVH